MVGFWIERERRGARVFSGQRAPKLPLLFALLLTGIEPTVTTLKASANDVLLADAVQNGDKVTTLALIQKQVNINAPQGDGTTALHWTVYFNDAETTALLIRAGAEVNLPNNYDVTPLGLQSQNGDAAIIRQLIEAGADPNDPLHAINSGETPLMLAARSGHVDSVKALLTAGANIDATETWNG